MDTLLKGHLEKYFELARNRFSEGDHALATFFALTLLEECGKLLALRDVTPGDEQDRATAKDHPKKYSVAAINLIDQSDRLDALRSHWEGTIRNLLSDDRAEEMGEAFLWLRNDSLYAHRDKRGHWITPDQAVDRKKAALLVYLAGMAMAELELYLDGVAKDWANAVVKAADQFRVQFLQW